MQERTDRETLGQWLKRACVREGLSLRDAGKRSGLSHSTIRDIINDKTTPSPETVRKIARGFSDGHHRVESLEKELLYKAGHISQLEEDQIREPVARLLDTINDFNEPQLKVLTRFADFLAEMEASK